MAIILPKTDTFLIAEYNHTLFSSLMQFLPTPQETCTAMRRRNRVNVPEECVNVGLSTQVDCSLFVLMGREPWLQVQSPPLVSQSGPHDPSVQPRFRASRWHCRCASAVEPLSVFVKKTHVICSSAEGPPGPSQPAVWLRSKLLSFLALQTYDVIHTQRNLTSSYSLRVLQMVFYAGLECLRQNVLNRCDFFKHFEHLL